MNYEEYLDEVTTLITEHYNLDDAAAIKLVIEAQAADFFVRHDEDAALRNQAQAELDAASIFNSAA